MSSTHCWTQLDLSGCGDLKVPVQPSHHQEALPDMPRPQLLLVAIQNFPSHNTPRPSTATHRPSLGQDGPVEVNIVLLIIEVEVVTVLSVVTVVMVVVVLVMVVSVVVMVVVVGVLVVVVEVDIIVVDDKVVVVEVTEEVVVEVNSCLEFP